jgi:hypothetical protein
MKFFAIHLSDLESEQFSAASNEQIAAWLFLHALCCKRVNSGSIDDAADLPDRFWTRHGIDPVIIRQPSPLWKWTGKSLSIEPYDIEGEKLYLKKSQGGKAGMAKRWKTAGNKSLNKSLNRPDPTQPNPRKEKPISPEGKQFAQWFKTTLPTTSLAQTTWETSWAKTYDELTKIDNRDPKEIREVCQWARTDNFWKAQFQSPTKLRKRNKDGVFYYDVFLALTEQGSTAKHTTVNTGRRTANIEEV